VGRREYFCIKLQIISCSLFQFLFYLTELSCRIIFFKLHIVWLVVDICLAKCSSNIYVSGRVNKSLTKKLYFADVQVMRLLLVLLLW
jgi:hypothetical protein